MVIRRATRMLVRRALTVIVVFRPRMSHPPELDPRSKLLSHDAVDESIAAARSAGHRIGFTCGSFDIMHASHVQYLARLRFALDGRDSGARCARMAAIRSITPDVLVAK